MLSLTLNSGERIYIAISVVGVMEPTNSGTRLTTTIVKNEYGTINTFPKQYLVRETPEEILVMMKDWRR